MKPHKWAKEIKAWADGAEIEGKWQLAKKDSLASEWCVLESPDWDTEAWIYRIKPQPKEPQYLYVWKPYDSAEDLMISDIKPNGIVDDGIYKLIGKIKLEQDE